MAAAPAGQRWCGETSDSLVRGDVEFKICITSRLVQLAYASTFVLGSMMRSTLVSSSLEGGLVRDR